MLIGRTIFAVVLALAALTSAAYAQTITAMVLQEDWDQGSIERDNRIQRWTRTEFQKVLSAPSQRSYMRQFGLEGLDVIDETAVTQNMYNLDRRLRSRAELIELARAIRDTNVDVIILYTLYAKAVELPYSGINALQASMQYDVLDLKSSRILGGDTLKLDTAGIPFQGCATTLNKVGADEHCVKEFVAEHAQGMAADAANRIAVQIGSLLGQAYSSGDQAYNPDEGETEDEVNSDIESPDRTARRGCANTPSTFTLTFKGIEQRDMNAIEEFMAEWECGLDIDVLNATPSQATYTFKTRDSRQRLMRNIRQMFEMMGIRAEPSTNGENEIIVEAVQLAVIETTRRGLDRVAPDPYRIGFRLGLFGRGFLDPRGGEWK
jgi:hypothetical protein